MTKKITLMAIKQALKDGRFRDTLPLSMRDDLAKYLQNPNCGSCSLPLLKKIFKECKKQLLEYFPGSELSEEEIVEKMENNFNVINCKIDELQDRLRRLGPGRKQIAICRWQDEATAIINELD